MHRPFRPRPHRLRLLFSLFLLASQVACKVYTDDNNENVDKSDNTGAIVAIVSLLLLIVALVGGYLIYKYFKKRKESKVDKEQDAYIPPAELKPYMIPATDFKFNGPLTIMEQYNGPIRHKTEEEQSASLKVVEYDPELNEAFETGNNIEIIKKQHEMPVKAGGNRVEHRTQPEKTETVGRTETQTKSSRNNTIVDPRPEGDFDVTQHESETLKLSVEDAQRPRGEPTPSTAQKGRRERTAWKPPAPLPKAASLPGSLVVARSQSRSSKKVHMRKKNASTRRPPSPKQ